MYQIGSVLVSHIHTYLVLVIGINSDWYIKLFLAFSSQNPILHPVPLRRNSNNTHMNLNCQPEIMLLSSDWLPETLPLLLWPKMLLLGIGIGVCYKLSHDGVGMKEIEDLTNFDLVF